MPATAPVDTPPARLGSLLLVLGTGLAATPWLGAGMALLSGVALAWLLPAPLPQAAIRARQALLQAGVVGLGFAVDLNALAEQGISGLLVSGGTIAATLLAARGLARWLGVDPTVGLLIGAGTAICGGSAIAAVAAALRVRDDALAAALGVVFVLNAAALAVFPAVGHALALSPETFGAWAGIAIHDVSSVVGAALAFDDSALPSATTVKLSRTLWIVPLTLVLAARAPRTTGTPAPRATIPWFIALFIAASALRTLLPAVAAAEPALVGGAKALLTAALFLVGAGLGRRALAQTGARAFGLGVLLATAVAAVSLALLDAYGV